MDHHIVNNNNCVISSSFQPLTTASSSSLGREESSSLIKENPRKKRSKFTITPHGGGVISKPAKTTRKPDPSAPKITRPCTECGKKFWSWKALFGHMRCHPERQWRGINPPHNFRRQMNGEDRSSDVTEEEHEVATCLLLLANGIVSSTNHDQESPNSTACSPVNVQGTPLPLEYYCHYYYYYHSDDGFNNHNANNNVSNWRGTFECSSCKKVFGSHQALGGHRASHKNVKGCYAITKNIDNIDQEYSIGGGDILLGSSGHKCRICMKVFSNVKALDEHKIRCHWDNKAAEDVLLLDHDHHQEGFDLNLGAKACPVVDHDQEYHSSYSSVDSGLHHPNLDLRLRL